MLKRYLGRDLRSIFQIDERGRKILRELFFTRDHGAQAIVRRRKIAAHNHINAVGGAGRIGVRIFFPSANHLERQQLAADGAEQHFAVGCLHLAKTLRIESRRAHFELFEAGDMLLNAAAREIFKLGVKSVYAKLRRESRIVRKKFLIQKIVDQRVPNTRWN